MGNAPLVTCSRHLPREIQISARQCLENFMEAMRREEMGCRLFAWESCLFCPVGLSLNPLEVRRPGRQDAAPTSGIPPDPPGIPEPQDIEKPPVPEPSLANFYESLGVDVAMVRQAFADPVGAASSRPGPAEPAPTKPKRLPRWWPNSTPAVRRAYLQGPMKSR